MAYTIQKASSLSAPRGEQAVGAIWRMFNLLVAALDGHVHPGVTAGAAASTGWNAPATVVKLAHNHGRIGGAVVAPVGAGTLATFTPRSRQTSTVYELLVAINLLLDTVQGHTHVVTAGAANSGAWAAPATIRKVADLNGRDADGTLVTPSANGQAVLRLAGVGRSVSTEGGALVKAWNALVQALDGHVHAGVTAGGANSGVNAPAFTTANTSKVADLYGRDVDGAVVV